MELVISKVFMKDQWVSANTTKLVLKEEWLLPTSRDTMRKVSSE